MSVKTENFGTTKDGREINLYTISNGNMEIKVTDMGAVLVSAFVPDKNGNLQDVVLGLSSGEKYETSNVDAFGATVGRSCNRIAGCKFILNGKEYTLEDNDSGNSLHCGPNMYFTRLWDSEIVADETGEGVEFSILSPDGDQGMPGNLEISVTYLLTQDNSIIIEYRGVCDEDTIFNPTNHSYFNLGGHKSGSIEDELVWIDAEQFVFGTEGRVSDDNLYDVEGTPLDFRQLRRIGESVDADSEFVKARGGYDHNFCLKTTRGTVDLVAKVVDEKTGIVMNILTDLPGLQMYTGNFINHKNEGKEHTYYDRREGVAFETQFYPDAINHSSFPSPILKAEEEFLSCTVYQFDTLD